MNRVIAQLVIKKCQEERLDVDEVIAVLLEGRSEYSTEEDEQWEDVDTLSRSSHQIGRTSDSNTSKQPEHHSQEE